MDTADARKARVRHLFTRGLIYTVLSIGALIAVAPFVWMILTSLKSYREVATRVVFPATLRFSNYVLAWNAAPFARYFANSLFVSLCTVAGVLATSILAAYSFSWLNFRGKDWVFTLYLATMMIPGQLLLIPNFLTITRLGWIDTYWAQTVPWIASVFNVFLLKQFFATIPKDLYDAAVLDGCGHFRYLVQIILPLCKPALITVGLNTFLGSWNSLQWPLIVSRSESMRPIQVGLSYFLTESGTDTQEMMAAAAMTIFPIVIIYFFAQKHFMEGISTSGLKG
ncbi:MAG TPA: carbohydrate ABC transporter permease [Anaerolineae bacterium]|nr:carbohydrate ABC transporter permease [Anaerolineae bacterium]